VDALLRGERWTKEQEEIAIKRAMARVNAGAVLPSFSTIDEAEFAARRRSAAGGSTSKFNKGE
jgi:hypothetical protein